MPVQLQRGLAVEVGQQGPVPPGHLAQVEDLRLVAGHLDGAELTNTTNSLEDD